MLRIIGEETSSTNLQLCHGENHTKSLNTLLSCSDYKGQCEMTTILIAHFHLSIKEIHKEIKVKRKNSSSNNSVTKATKQQGKREYKVSDEIWGAQIKARARKGQEEQWTTGSYIKIIFDIIPVELGIVPLMR